MKIQKLKDSIFKHKEAVAKILFKLIDSLERRALTHDDSKLDKDEIEAFLFLDSHEVKFGDYAYLKHAEAFKQHHRKNRHHPDYHKNGINDMTLTDILEMYADWRSYAANKDEFMAKLEFNSQRFKINGQLQDIFINTFNKGGENE